MRWHVASDHERGEDPLRALFPACVLQLADDAPIRLQLTDLDARCAVKPPDCVPHRLHFDARRIASPSHLCNVPRGPRALGMLVKEIEDESLSCSVAAAHQRASRESEFSRISRGILISV